MKENATISLKTKQYALDGQEDVIELVTKGTFAQHEGSFYVVYEESEMTGFVDTTTTIKITDNKITLSRKGKFQSRMEFIKGEKRLCSYPTPYGLLPVAVSPTLMKSNLSKDEGGNVILEYILDLNNKAYAKNKLEMSVKLNGGQTK